MSLMGIAAPTTGLQLRSLAASAPARSNGRFARTKRPIAMLFAAILIALGISTTGASLIAPTGSTAQPAHACFFLDVACKTGEAVQNAVCMNPDLKELPFPDVWPGNIVGFIQAAGYAGLNLKSMSAIAPMNGTDWSSRIAWSKNFTRYEWYGAAGTRIMVYPWAEVGSGCAIIYQAMAIPSSILLEIMRVTNFFQSMVLSTAITVDLIPGMFKSGGVIATLLKAMKDKFFFPFLLPMVMIAGMWLMWRTFVQRRARDGIQGMIWVAASAAFSAMFLANPGAIANGLDSLTVQTSSWIVSTASSATSSNAGASCVPSTTSNTTAKETLDYTNATPVQQQYGVRVIQCSLWETFVLLPWSSATMGSQAFGITIDNPVGSTFHGDKSLVGTVLDATTLSLGDVASGQGFNPDTVSHKQQEWEAAGAYIIKPESASIINWDLWAGRAPIQQFSVLLLGLLAQLAASFPLLIMSFSMIAQQIIFVMLVLIAPIYLTLGIHPGFGRRSALGWLEMVLSTFLKRIILAGLIAVLLAYYGAIVATGGDTSTSAALGAFGGQWWARAVLLVIGAFGILKVRKRILKEASSFIDLNGRKPGLAGITEDATNRAGSRIRGALGTIGTELLVGAGAVAAGKKLGEHEGLRDPNVRRDLFRNAAKAGGAKAVSGVPVVGAATANYRRGRNERLKAEEDRQNGTSQTEDGQTPESSAQQTSPVGAPTGVPAPAGAPNITPSGAGGTRTAQTNAPRPDGFTGDLAERPTPPPLSPQQAMSRDAAIKEIDSYRVSAPGYERPVSGYSSYYDANRVQLASVARRLQDPNLDPSARQMAMRELRERLLIDSYGSSVEMEDGQYLQGRDQQVALDGEYRQMLGIAQEVVYQTPEDKFTDAEYLDRNAVNMGYSLERIERGEATPDEIRQTYRYALIDDTAQLYRQERGAAGDAVSSSRTMPSTRPARTDDASEFSDAPDSTVSDRTRVRPMTDDWEDAPSAGSDNPVYLDQDTSALTSDADGETRSRRSANVAQEAADQAAVAVDRPADERPRVRANNETAAQQPPARPGSRRRDLAEDASSDTDVSTPSQTSGGLSNSDRVSIQGNIETANAELRQIPQQIRAIEQKRENLLQRESEVQLRIAQFEAAGNREGAAPMRRVLEELQQEKRDIEAIALPNLQKRADILRRNIDQLRGQLDN